MIQIPELTINHYVSGIILIVWLAFMFSAWRKYDGPMFHRMQERWMEFKMNYHTGAEKGLEKRKAAIEKAKDTVKGDED